MAQFKRLNSAFSFFNTLRSIGYPYSVIKQSLILNTKNSDLHNTVTLSSILQTQPILVIQFCPK